MKDLNELKRLGAAGTPLPWVRALQECDDCQARLYSLNDAALVVAAVNALPDLIAEIEQLRGTQTPAAWMVIRDSHEPPEVFITEEAARENACLGVCDTHVYPLFHQNSCAYSGHERRIERLEAALREIAVGCDTRTPRDIARAALPADIRGSLS